MKRLLALCSVLLSCAVSPSFALTVTIGGNNAVAGGYNGFGAYQTGVGGEFTFSISDPTLISGYASTTRNQGGSANSFQTFCVEGGENIYANQTYSAVFNNQTVSSNVRLTVGASFLYSQFAQGRLTTAFNPALTSSYNYTGSATGRENSANLLQRAIWLLMGGQEGLNAGNIGVNPFISLVLSRFGSLAAANVTAATGADHVYVLNLLDSGGRNAQDQLIYTTAAIIPAVPDGGTTAIMLGIGFTGATILSRRLRRK
jgi:hypothetical protein